MSSSPASYEPTEADLLAVLKGHKEKNDALKLEAIQNVLIQAHQQQNTITNAIVRLFRDPQSDQALTLVESFKNLLPEKSSVIKANNQGLDKCSTMLMSIYNIFRAVILQKEDGSSNVPACFTPVFDIIDIVKARFFQAKVALKNSLFLKVPEQMNRRYLKSATVPPEGYTTCVLCDHSIVDCPISNQGVMDRNDLKRHNYERELQQFNSEKTTNSNKRAPKKPTYEDAILVCHCAQSHCNNMEGGHGCEKLCRMTNGERHEIILDTASGFRTCSCDVCMCQCRAIYALSSVADIKLGLICEGKKTSQFQHHHGNQSKGKSQLSSDESVGMIRKRLGLDRIASTVDDANCEKLANELSRDISQHVPFIETIRADIWPQMIGGKATLIQTESGAVSVRALHNSGLMNRHAHNNNLNKNVIHQVSTILESTSTVIDLSHGHLENTPSSIIELVDSSNEDETGNENKVVISKVVGDKIDSKNVASAEDSSSSIIRKRSISTVSFSDETIIDNLYNEVRTYCFKMSREGNQYNCVSFSELWTHLASDCIICKKVIHDMLSTGVGITMEDALEEIERLMPMHYVNVDFM